MKAAKHVYGEENIPSEGPVCYVSNHQGYCDIPCYFTALRKIQFGFVAKDDLEKVPKYGDWIKRVRSSMIKRGDPRASLKAILEGIEYIEQGFSMLIFPEGTRAMCSAMMGAAGLIIAYNYFRGNLIPKKEDRRGFYEKQQAGEK